MQSRQLVAPKLQMRQPLECCHRGRQAPQGAAAQLQARQSRQPAELPRRRVQAAEPVAGQVEGAQA